MRTVFKYPVPIDDVTHDHHIPTSAKPVHVAQQGVAVCMWFEIDTLAPAAIRSFRVFGTGHRIPDDFRYVGTGLDGPFVWHVYERMPGSGGA